MREKKMTIDDAIAMLKEEYREASGKSFICNPVAYALYQVWKLADERSGK